MEHPVLLFDGVCNLCNHTVQFIISQDKNAFFRFASLQSEIGQTLLKKQNIVLQNLESVVLIYQNKVYTHSDAPLEVAFLLGGFWKMAYFFKIFPAFLRNSVYRFIAKHRYHWFGKQESCWLPTAELKMRFL